jgi:phosphopantothenoylcysteine decarboxylase / phosphopantothenate---cysteine ligase
VTRILLGAGASAALHKACDLASLLAQSGHEVRVLLTPNAARLVSPQLFEALTGQAAQVREFGAQRRGAMDHIELSAWGELLLVAPATADLVARLALGLSGDLLSTVALALPVERARLLAPAMNPRMLAAPVVERHLATLRGDGWHVLETGVGHMACGDAGKGRLPEPEAILAELRRLKLA